MEGGGWNSETFDNGRGFAKAPRNAQAATEAAPGGLGVAGATPPAMYNPGPGTLRKESRSWGVTAVALRVAQVVLTLIGFSLMAANKAVIYYSYVGYYTGTTYYGRETVKFSDVKALVALLSMDIIVCVYAIVQLTHSIFLGVSKGSLASSPTTSFAFLTFLFDQLLAFALMGAAAGAANSVAEGKDEGYCDNLPSKFCNKSAASIAITFIAILFLVVSAILYPVRLLRLAK